MALEEEDRGPGLGTRLYERIAAFGEDVIDGIGVIGFAAVLFGHSCYFIFFGWRENQPVRFGAVVSQCMEVGIHAIPIIGTLSGAIGVTLALQGIYTLSTFGAEHQVVLGVAFSVTREFAPLITGILVAGRSGSALAARLGTMKINQEIDALKAIGIHPVRFLVVPAVLSMVIMVPALTLFSMFCSLFTAGLYVGVELGMSLPVFFQGTLDSLSINDVLHGIGKSAIFAILIALIGVINGANVEGGAEGVGKATTRAVVMAISSIIVTDMIFVFLLTR